MPEHDTKRTAPGKGARKAGDPKESHAPKGSKKTKPSFSLPAETDAAESAAGWVYREPQSSAPPADKHLRDVGAAAPVVELAHGLVQDKLASPNVGEQTTSDQGKTEPLISAVTVTVVTHAPASAFDAEPIAAPASSAPVSPAQESNYMLGAAAEVMILSVVSVGFAVMAVIRLIDLSIAAGSSVLPGTRRSS
ncbi:MAG: hypothetical protein ABL967_05840 [Bryobacteraceae bacterium]